MNLRPSRSPSSPSPRQNSMFLAPKVALLSRSNFGLGSSASGAKMRRALELVREAAPDLEIDGEMHGDCALDEALRLRPAVLHAQGRVQSCWCARTWTRATSPTTCSRRGGRRQRGGRSGSAGRQRAGAHPDLQLDRAPHRQHDRDDCGRCQYPTLKSTARPAWPRTPTRPGPDRGRRARRLPGRRAEERRNCWTPTGIRVSRILSTSSGGTGAINAAALACRAERPHLVRAASAGCGRRSTPT